MGGWGQALNGDVTLYPQSEQRGQWLLMLSSFLLCIQSSPGSNPRE